MSVKQCTECWTAKCDGCQTPVGGRDCSNESGSHYASEADATSGAKAEGWTIDAEGWWCEDCHDARVCREIGHQPRTFDYTDGPRTYCARCGIHLANRDDNEGIAQ